MTRNPRGDLVRAPHQLATSLSADEFTSVFRGHPGGVAVITADPGTGPVALTATSVASVSAEPPLLVFSLSSRSSAAAAISASDSVVVHLLDEHDIDLARLGATSGVDRFADTTAWARLATGEPVFPGVRAWVRCAIVNRMEAGGSTVILALALQHHLTREAGSADGGGALVYHNRTWHRLGEHSTLS